MNNTLKVLCVLSVLAGISACGDDDGGDNPGSKDSGPPITVMDAGIPDTGAPSIDAFVPPSDTGVVVPPTGTPKTMLEFLNAPTTADVQNPTKTLAVPAALLTPSGGVLPL